MIDWVGRIEETPADVKDSTNNFDNLSNLDIRRENEIASNQLQGG